MSCVVSKRGVRSEGKDSNQKIFGDRIGLVGAGVVIYFGGENSSKRADCWIGYDLRRQKQLLADGGKLGMFSSGLCCIYRFVLHKTWTHGETFYPRVRVLICHEKAVNQSQTQTFTLESKIISFYEDFSGLSEENHF